MPSKSFLRILIVAQFGLFVLAIVVALLTVSLLPEPLRAYAEAEARGEMTTRNWDTLRLIFPVLMLWLGSSIGLFFFWRPSRIFYLIYIVLGLLVTPFLGPNVDTGWSRTFEEAASIVSGVILALVYFSPLKNLYERASNPKDVTLDEVR